MIGGVRVAAGVVGEKTIRFGRGSVKVKGCALRDARLAGRVVGVGVSVVGGAAWGLTRFLVGALMRVWAGSDEMV